MFALHSTTTWYDQPEEEEVSEQNTEELIGNLIISAVHFQFRRLQDGDIPRNTKLTAIPEHKLVLNSLPYPNTS